MNQRLRLGFESEMSQAFALYLAGELGAAFRHLERAHVLSQAHALPHLRVHVAMLRIGVARRDAREILGQWIRVLGAAPASLLGRYPRGNTGGANVHLMRPMPIPPDLEALLDGT